MPRGSKKKYTAKQKRQARDIEKSVRKRGGSEKTAERIGWATVNKEYGKAGTNKIKDKSPSVKGGKKGGKSKTKHKPAKRNPAKKKKTTKKKR